MNNTTKRLNLNLPLAIYQRFKEQATSENKTVTKLLTTAINNYLSYCSDKEGSSKDIDLIIEKVKQSSIEHYNSMDVVVIVDAFNHRKESFTYKGDDYTYKRGSYYCQIYGEEHKLFCELEDTKNYIFECYSDILPERILERIALELEEEGYKNFPSISWRAVNWRANLKTR